MREMRRKNQQLPMDESIEILEKSSSGVLAVSGDGGYPYAVPMSYVWFDGKIYFHCGKVGHRLDALKKDGKVSFCVYDKGYREEGCWPLNVKSVIVFGTIDIVDDIDKITDITTKLSYKFTNDDAYIKTEIEKHAARTLLLVLTPEHICGKLVEES